MIHRLGMYYLARQLQDAQDAKAAVQRKRRATDVSDQEELGIAQTGAALLVAIGTVGLALWVVN